MKEPIVAFTCIFFVSILFLVSPASADYPMYRSGPSRNGVGTGSPALNSTQLWTSNISFPIPYNGGSYTNSWSSPVVDDGVLYICAETDFVNILLQNPRNPEVADWADVYAFNATSGAQIWDYRGNTTQFVIGISTPAVADGAVFFCFSDVVGALNDSNGASLWNNTAVNYAYSSPAFVNGVVYTGETALNATNGEIIWNDSFGSVSYSAPAVSNSVVYVGTYDGNLYALNATNGDRIWSFTTGVTINTPAVVNGVVYASSDDGNLYALKASTGLKLWSFNTTSFTTSPAVTNEAVYFCEPLPRSLPNATVLYALNVTNGAELWNYTVGNYGDVASPVVVGGIVYACDVNDIFGLNAVNGTLVWSHIADNYPDWTDPAVANGVLYDAGANGGEIEQVYAYGIPSTPSSTPTLTSLTSHIFSTPEVLGVGLAIFVIIVVFAVIVLRKRSSSNNRTKEKDFPKRGKLLETSHSINLSKV